ncbi:MAG: dUTP diphosphatase [Clostridia bacterium]|nr:dUTP diphosphatase [Clostridia bacterium]
MKHVSVKIKKLRPDAILPKYGTPYAAGADLYACMDEDVLVIESGETKFVHTGLSIELPDGTVGLVYARSGLASKRGIAPANKVGVVDSDYRGEIMVAMHNHSLLPQSIEKGERVAQLVVAPYLTADFEEVDELAESERGISGFGSTGNK